MKFYKKTFILIAVMSMFFVICLFFYNGEAEHSASAIDKSKLLDVKSEDVVQIVQALDARVDRLDMVAHRADRHDGHSFFVELVGIKFDRAGDDDDLRLRAEIRIQAQFADALGLHR